MVAKTLFILFLLHLCGQHYQMPLDCPSPLAPVNVTKCVGHRIYPLLFGIKNHRDVVHRMVTNQNHQNERNQQRCDAQSKCE